MLVLAEHCDVLLWTMTCQQTSCIRLHAVGCMIILSLLSLTLFLAQAMIVTLGKNNGAMHISGWWVPWFLPTFLKSKDLFVKKTRHELGLAAASR